MKSTIRPRIEGTIQFFLTESEARALYAITEYGYESFVEVFMKHLGRHYIEPHLPALEDLFHHIRNQTRNDLSVLDRTRNYMNAELKKDPRYK